MSGKVDLDRWGPHLRAAKRQGKSVKQYAVEHGLSPYTLYAAREMVKAKARVKGSEVRAASGLSAFAEVKLARAQEVAALSARDDVAHVQVFENKGTMMGCSNPHPHCQVWATAPSVEAFGSPGPASEQSATKAPAGPLVASSVVAEADEAIAVRMRFFIWVHTPCGP